MDQDRLEKDQLRILPMHSGSDSIVDNRFDCNICLDTVDEPVTTLCGHIFCWECFYKWLRSTKAVVESNTKGTCPVCKSSCSIETLVPIYARSENTVSVAKKIHPLQDGEALRDSKKNGEIDTDLNNTRLSIDIPARPKNRMISCLNQPLLSASSRIPSQTNVSDQGPLSGPSSAFISLEPIYLGDRLEDESTFDFLSRLLLLLGTFVVFCLLIF